MPFSAKLDKDDTSDHDAVAVSLFPDHGFFHVLIWLIVAFSLHSIVHHGD
jgi:hypothetical protein